MKTMRFKTASEFRRWLGKNCERSEGIWLRIYKKKSGEKSVTYAEALDQAVCHGWIDGQTKPLDERSWLRKFTPRRAKSGWSKINTENVERLIRSGKMTKAGMKAVEAAKADGRWKVAYASSKNAVVPADFLKEVAKSRKAQAFFRTLNKTNIYSIVYRLETAKKPETRTRRMKMILEMMKAGQTFHP